jgi:DNA-binding transcriptional ArsR family regulator
MQANYDSPELDIVLEALANQKRRGIIHDLSLSPSTVKQLGARHGLSLPAIHKHMNLLESAGLIVRKKSGRTNFIALNPKTLRLAQAWINQYKAGWGSPAATLENYISSMRE